VPRLNRAPHFTLGIANGALATLLALRVPRVEPFFGYEVAEAAELMPAASANFTSV
jgi:hypothetical protein